MDTLSAKIFVLISDVSLIQGCPLKGFHCTLNAASQYNN